MTLQLSLFATADEDALWSDWKLLAKLANEGINVIGVAPEPEPDEYPVFVPPPRSVVARCWYCGGSVLLDGYGEWKCWACARYPMHPARYPNGRLHIRHEPPGEGEDDAELTAIFTTPPPKRGRSPTRRKRKLKPANPALP